MKSFSIFFLFVLASHLLFAQKSAEKYLDAGYEKYEEEDYKGAILDFKKAISYEKDNAEAYYLRGVCYSLLGEKKSAISDLDKATEINTDYAEAYYEKGYIYLSDQNAEKAIEEFDKVIKLKPDFAEAYVSRGTAKCMLNDKDGAAADWKKAEQLGVGYTDYMICE